MNKRHNVRIVAVGVPGGVDRSLRTVVEEEVRSSVEVEGRSSVEVVDRSVAVPDQGSMT